MIKPPVGPVITSIPERPLENTGTPVTPSPIYNTTENKAYCMGNTSATSRIATVWKVSGTGSKGTDTQAPAHINKVNKIDIRTSFNLIVGTINWLYQ